MRDLAERKTIFSFSVKPWITYVRQPNYGAQEPEISCVKRGKFWVRTEQRCCKFHELSCGWCQFMGNDKTLRFSSEVVQLPWVVMIWWSHSCLYLGPCFRLHPNQFHGPLKSISRYFTKYKIKHVVWPPSIYIHQGIWLVVQDLSLLFKIFCSIPLF